MKNLTLIICMSIGVNLYNQTNGESTKFKIDGNIKNEVEENISESEFGDQLNDDIFLIYDTPIIADYYENDSLVNSTKNDKQLMLFKSFYYSFNDTLTIDGFYGLFGGFGFSIKFIENKPIVYHMLASDEFPTYSMTQNGKLELRIEVPCNNTMLTLSKDPNLKEEEILYGKVEFESEEYYQRGVTINGKEVEERKKINMNMKIYFKSKFLNLEKLK